jgi:hypothetical protein
VVHLVHLVCFVHRVGLLQPNKRDNPHKPNNGLLTLAIFFYSLLQYTPEYADIQTMTSIDLPTEFRPALFMTVRREIAQSRRETGARSPEDPMRTRAVR